VEANSQNQDATIKKRLDELCEKIQMASLDFQYDQRSSRIQYGDVQYLKGCLYERMAQLSPSHANSISALADEVEAALAIVLGKAAKWRSSRSA
jgi:hypothetical protein